ncbi:ABC transporter substrate-binding protein [Dolosicoccus paucivorans]|uniref:ABC transporter substrate-binding protein n=1 Tax=Dolosicoccus paucivorans TaxID=84521 RepID=UPI00088FD661|nr:ABC transporter substrate-binding protein [Dolosicoccus paucivorans]SDI25781.1 putative ABC transport system substrate-binding protein [Dolosicoccus paucivorans]
MKRFIQGLMLIILVLTSFLPISLTGFAQEKELSVAIVIPINHPSLDEIASGIVAGLEEAGYVEGENLKLTIQNAQSDMSMLSTIADSVVEEDPDLIFAIATPAAQALQQRTQDIPIILAGVSDPVGAGLVDHLEKPGGNITGVSDVAPLDKQFDVIEEFLPEIKTVGMIYTNSEDNSKFEVDQAKEIAEARGIQVEVTSITTALDMQLIAQELAPKVDAVFVPTDNNIASAFETLVTQTDNYQIPIFPTVEAMVSTGGVASIGISQKGIGEQAAQMGLEVLKTGTPETTPIQQAEKTKGVYSSETASYLDLNIPERIQKEFTDVSKEE